ncbi:MAG: gamma-glutamyltransferase [Gemmatales bacterium]|nr:gamma-glutamyltransferase [Gemmatales bacterium]MDW8175662.1 gamma-glutamyltransferase [Gemmatales bacterium]
MSDSKLLMQEGHSRREFLKRTVGVLWCGASSSGASAQVQERDFREASGRNGLVVSVSAPATQVGIEILRAGGNAVDAAVAVAFALAVTYPPAGNIGGGGFMNVFVPPVLRARFPKLSQPAIVVDYREVAPLKAHREMFQRGDSPHQHKAVGVPGTVAGLALAHAMLGKLPWRRVVEPAIALARDGFAVDAPLASSLQNILNQSKAFPELQRVFAPPDGQRWKAGAVLRQADLAWTLKQIADGGAEAFYHGPIAEKIIAEMQRGGGWIHRDDLKAYRPKLRSAIFFRFGQYEIYSNPPASSGGITLSLILRQVAEFPYRQWGRWDLRTLHVLIEAMRRAYVERARWLGDPDFVPIPDHLLDPEFARRLAKSIRLDRATPSRELAPDIVLTPEGTETTHFSVLDADGIAVANTYTLEHSYGSRIVVRGAGFLLNNEMTDFNWFPERTTAGGLIGTPPNQIAPGKRMLSSMTPTIAVRDSRPVLITGSPGGRTIINTVAQIILNRLAFELPPRSSVDLPRLHHQWFPDEVRYEPADSWGADLLQGLRRLGHQVVAAGRQGDAHSIFYDDERATYHAVADGRVSGSAGSA